ncbi:LolA-like outer membrane lipoprotein chaperone [Arcobacter sp. LA11]|uniref:LolA-like outer membrane lipoprotein chaperone n=1 Tax=Arcobacter sp. LA11 TaxID=1898176 RepID=UPI000932F3AC|nr:LolA-like outer membrane lipoprotein chaperone [Arcobacter sp. LA11]
MVYRFLVLVMMFFSNVFASSQLENLKSFEAEFIQSVTNEANKTIEYKGKVFIKNSGKVLWKYETPIIKNVYVLDNIAIVDEPELEQAIYTTLENSIDIVKLLKDAKKVENNKFEAELYSIKYIIFLENDKIKSLSYVDQLENKVSINFDNPNQNIEISDDIFTFLPPEHYDIIKK